MEIFTLNSTFLIRAALAAALLTAPIAAFADSQGTASTSIRPPIADSAMVNPNAYNVAPPGTGVAATDYANLSAAFATSNVRPVYISGTYEICQPGLVVPANGIIMGAEVSGWNNFGNNWGANRAVIQCTGSYTYGSRDAFISMYDRSKLVNFTIHGLRELGNPSVDCINAINSTAIVIKDMTIMLCDRGINRASTSSPPTGRVNAYSQLLRLDGGYVVSNNYGYYSDCANGGFVADDQIHNVNFMFNQIEQIHGDCNYTSSVESSRIEDGFYGVIMKNGCCWRVSGNMFDRVTHDVYIENMSSATVSSNQLHGWPSTEGGPTCCAVELAGNNVNIEVGANYAVNNTAFYRLISGSTSGNFYGQYGNAGSVNAYYDAATKAALAPWTTPRLTEYNDISLTGSAFAAPNLAAFSNVRMTLVASACPCSIPNPSSAFEGTTGVIAIAQDTLGADTVTWGTNFVGTAPTLSTTPGDIDYIPYLVAGGKIVRGAKSTAGAPANLLAGGNGMTSASWPSVTGATLTNAVGTDPLGGGNASALKETSTTAGHDIGQAITDPGGPIVCSLYVHAGTSGTRNIEMLIWDASFASNAWVVFSQAGVNTGSGASGGSSVSGITSTSVGGGWTKVGATLNLNTTKAFFFLFMDNGTNSFAPGYAGDNVSNIWLWGPNCH